ncbi:MAG: acetolactate synthase, large subunit, biosynthetic type [Spirochaetes bacterium GWF1_41_5]|nr:MAG: acetolactate synthase, large subunit, biosynthetic type [Spirochaetes bacterium GWF1_41_5]HBE03933.1 biosynthetic-type acetolactate synthase large subunit [Spirochaetia bacterium]
MKNKMSGAKILIDALVNEKAEYIFGYIGGQVIPIFDELFGRKDITMIVPRHEQGAAHAADGYARVTGRPGVCLATSGPGATNLVTGIANAYMDSIPMIAITGQVPTTLIGNDAFQEADITGITRPITKHNYLVKNIDDLADIVKEAFYIAASGRPGPVLIDLPSDISKGEAYFNYKDSINLRGYKPNYTGNPRQIKNAAAMIKQAKKPVIFSGGGILHSNASEELLKFVEKTGIPITTSLMGMGSIPSIHPLFLGMPGMHGTYYANMAITHCDLLVAIGVRFDDRVTGKIKEFAPHAQIIHIDIDPTSVSKNIEVTLPIVGDAKNILGQLVSLCEKSDCSIWLDEIDKWKKSHKLTYHETDHVIKPQFVIESIDKITGGEAIIATEVGQHQMWTAQFFKFKYPRQFITSGGLGTMGFGLPAAIGAQIAAPDKIVFDIAGDGSIQMNSQELATCVNYNIPVKIAILNNNYLGMVRQWQELFYSSRYSGTCLRICSHEKYHDKCNKACESDNKEKQKYTPDFVKLADAYGALGIRITEKKDVEGAIKKALAYQGPVVMDFHTDQQENVMPMVPAGAPINQMLITGIA